MEHRSAYSRARWPRVWLINEIGGLDAIAHRHEDIARQRHGRFQPERGRRLVQPGIDDEPAEPASDPDQPIALAVR
jgi:hypothetical protein